MLIKILRFLFLLLALGSSAIAQEAKRPTVPDAKTLAASGSQIAAWYRYAVALEAALAARDTPKIDAILSKVTAIEVKLAGGSGNTRPPTPPVINPPGPNQARVGSTITFTATADGDEPITWQWKKNGDPVSGWTSATLTLPSVTTNDTATYTVTATNAAGSSDGSFQLTIIP